MLVSAMVLANVGVVPKSAPAYDTVWSFAVPVAVPLLLLQADLRRIIPETGPILAAFFFGALGTLLGTLLGVALLDLGDSTPKLAAVFSAGYIGGSMNFAAVSEALRFDEATLLTAALAASNVVGMTFFILLVMLPSLAVVRRWLPAPSDNEGMSDDPEDDVELGGVQLRLFDVSFVLTLSFVICELGYWTAGALGIDSYSILFITGYTLIVANLFPARLRALTGSYEIGMLLMFLFFASIGASADFTKLVVNGPTLALFAGIILTTHIVVVLLGAKLFKLRIDETIVGSVACMPGPANAAAVAASRQWRHLITPGVLCGVLGYAIASFIGVALADILS